MWRDPGYLVEMLLKARDAREMAAGISLARLKTEMMPQYALAMALEQLGEAARKVSLEGKEAHPEIEWHAIVGLRNRIAQDYRRLDFDKIWDIVQHEVPALIAALEAIVPPDEEG